MRIRWGDAKYIVQVKMGNSGRWYWRVVARNNEPMSSSEVYSSRANAIESATAVADDAGWPLDVQAELPYP